MKRYLLASFALLTLVGCNYSSVNAYIDRWVHIKIAVPLEYSPEEEKVLTEFISGVREIDSIEKKIKDAGVQLTEEETAALQRVKSGSPKVARKIANRGQALRAAIERYNIRAWENDEKRMKGNKLTNAEILAALGPKPEMTKYNSGVEVKEQEEDGALRTIVVSVQE